MDSIVEYVIKSFIGNKNNVWSQMAHTQILHMGIAFSFYFPLSASKVSQFHFIKLY